MGNSRCRIKSVIFVVIFITAFLNNMNTHGSELNKQSRPLGLFTTLTENEIIEIDVYLDDIKKADKEYRTDSVIGTFDISESGEMIIGFNDGKINVYDSEGKYLYSFDCMLNSKYYLQFYNADILLYDLRLDRIYEFTRNGEVRKVWKYANTEADKKLIHKLSYERSRVVNGYTYKKTAYPSRFIKISPNNNQQVVYQALHIYPIGRMLYGLFFLLVAIHIIYNIINKVKNNSKTS